MLGDTFDQVRADSRLFSQLAKSGGPGLLVLVDPALGICQASSGLSIRAPTQTLRSRLRSMIPAPSR